MMIQEELDALEMMITYTLANEANSYDEWIEQGGKPDDHIYRCAEILEAYIKGLHSTGTYKRTT